MSLGGVCGGMSRRVRSGRSWAVVGAAVLAVGAAMTGSAGASVPARPAATTSTAAPAQPSATTAPARPSATTSPAQPSATTSPAATYIFWANYGSGGSGTTISRADLNGTQVRARFITGADGPLGVAVHDGYLYWSDPGLYGVCQGSSI